MNLAQGIDFNSLIEPVALRLLGEPAQKHGHEWRYGNRGSLSIDLAKGHWFDHEANIGGGVFDLIKRQGHEQPAAWLRREGLLATPQVDGRPQPRIAKTYGYCDENGTLLFQVVRFEPKGFRQRRPDGRGGWIWNLQDTRRVPYLLPELVKAVVAGETIYVPEGEKDVDKLRTIGLAATTNPGGIKKWRAEYSEYLRDADVVVLPDNHAEGREHGEQVVASLRGIAKRIRVLDIGKHWDGCPDKGDISDWLAAGGAADKLKAMSDAVLDAAAPTHNISSAQQSANDWIAGFAKKSQEERSKRAADNQIAPPPDEKALIEALARKDYAEYDRVRPDIAETLGMRVGTLDGKVEASRKKMEAEDHKDDLPHWKVEPWPEPVTGAELLDSIRRVFRRYIVLPKDADIALALWVLHAWTMDAGDISPFMVLVSPTKRCGKTSVLILLFFLTPKSELAANITASSLFRYIEAVRPTLLIDEADTFAKDNEELRGILNSGHTRFAANIIRNVEVNGEHKPRRFSTWAPKAIATIRGLADTLEDRAIVITLQRKPRNANVERLRRRDSEEFQRLRSLSRRWAADNFDKLVEPDPAVPEVLNDRAADNWRPLLAIADLAGGTWPEEGRRAACTLSGEEQDRAINVELLRDIKTAFGDAEEIRSADLIEKLVADKERPWADWKHGRPLTQKQLAGLLKPFCIISVNVRPLGLGQGKGYRRADFEQPWAAYCPGQTDPCEASIRPRADEMGTSSGFRSVPEAPWGGSKNSKLSHSNAGLDGWTGNERTYGGQGDFDPETGAAADPADDFPAFLRRCAYCNRNGALGRVALSDWPGTVWLHRECEGAWLEAATDKQTSEQ